MKKYFLYTLLGITQFVFPKPTEYPILFLNVNQAFNRHSKIAGSLEWAYLINLKEQVEFSIAGDIKTYCNCARQIEKKFIENKMTKDDYETQRQGLDHKLQELYFHREKATQEVDNQQDKIRHKLYSIATQIAIEKGANAVLVLEDDKIIYLNKECDITPQVLFELNRVYLEGMGVIIENTDIDYRLE
jgi:Skp family chaperone for outer membrane proteins